MDLIKQFAEAEFTKIFIKCILRYAEKYSIIKRPNGHYSGPDLLENPGMCNPSEHITHENVFILLGLDDQQEVTYKVLVNEPGHKLGLNPGQKPEFNESVTILDILNVRKLHLKGYDRIAPPYIKESLLRLAIEHSIDMREVSVLVCTNTEELILILTVYDNIANAGKGELVRMVSRLADISELF